MARTKSPPPSGIVTALLTDIVGSTKLKSLMQGETSARRDAAYLSEIKEPHDAMIVDCVARAHGHIVNSAGDSYCCMFADAEEAVLCALEIQSRLCERPIPTPLGPLQVRIGLHTGIAGPDGGQYVAATMDKAARVQSKAAGGQVLVSRETQALVAGKLRRVEFHASGSFELKGLPSEELYMACRAHTPTAAAERAAGPLLQRRPRRLSQGKGPVAGDSEYAPREAAPAPVPASHSAKDPAALQNPYSFSGVASRETFKGRQNELDELVDSVTSGSHTAIFGLQRMGKTSLIEEGLRERLARDPALARSVVLVDIDLMRLGGDEITYKDLFNAIIEAIVEKLKTLGIGREHDRVRELRNELWTARRYDRGNREPFFSDVATVLRGIADLARRRIVLFIDEFSQVRRVIERNKKALAGNPMRTKSISPLEMYLDVPFMHHLGFLLKDRELQKRFTLIVAVRPFMAEYDAKEDLQILKLMKPITLYYLDEPAARALITEPLAGLVEYEVGAVDYLYQLTAGHPYLLQVILNKVVDKVKRERRGTIRLEDIRSIEEKMISEGPAYDAQFEVVISDYSVAEVLHAQEALLGKGTLALIAKLGNEHPDGWVTEERVFNGLWQHKLAKEKTALLLSQLVRSKIVEEDGAADPLRYRIAVPLLRKRFVRQNLYVKYFR